MKKDQSKGIFLIGSLRKAGITVYQKQGRTVVRVSHSNERRSCTRQQFVQRQRMRHTIALWHSLSPCAPLFTERQSAYHGFAALANKLPAVFFSKGDAEREPSLLLPGMPVSDGSLPAIKEWLDVVDGTAALVTDIDPESLRGSGKLRLFTAEQCFERGVPRVKFKVRKVVKEELVETVGGWALVDADFAADDKGWALVYEWGGHCSPQGLVSRCETYRPYATEEALLAAAKTYGGLTGIV